MTKVLITGATGNVGFEVIKSLQTMEHQLDLYAGVRNLNADKIKLADYKIKFSQFDFMDSRTYIKALTDCDVVFLLRPPQISEVEKYFKPLIESCKDNGVRHIVFLSVQGVEKSKIIPHHKIEKLIVDSNIPYTFLRPAYFMQNFTTTLRTDLIYNRQIYLPAGKAKFTLIDVCDIGAVAASVLTNISPHKNKSYELTNKEKLSFAEMAKILSITLGFNIKFKSPNLLSFFLTKRKEKLPTMLILVIIMLHYFPRFQNEPEATKWVEKIINRRATTFEQFIKSNKRLLTQ
ncbi:MAG: NmrA family NAD(P)-binding protein [Chitinophagaceae bacterium]